MRRKPNPSTKNTSRDKEEPRYPLKTELIAVNLGNSKSSPLICYLCLCKGEQSLPLFEKSSKTVLKNIRTVFQIEPIQDEAVPDQICTYCVEKIDEFIAFRRMVVENHRKLELQVEEAKQVVTLEPYIKIDEKRDVDEKEKIEEHTPIQDFEEPHQSTTSLLPSSSSPKHFDSDKDDEYDILLREYFTFECPRCPQTFSRYRTLRQHVVREHKLNRFSIKCNQTDCSTAFRSRPALIEHLKKHGVVPKDIEPQFFCNTCGKGFERQSVLKNHLKRGSCIPVSNQRFQCHYCSALYSVKPAMVRHFQLCHGFEIPGRIAKHKCSKCSKYYMSKAGLIRHTRVIHERTDEVICEICAKVFAERSALSVHLSVHAPTPKVICPVCGAKLANKSSLCIHLRRSHHDQPTNCEICSKVFRNRTLLMNHMRASHAAPKHVCRECGKAFRFKEKLNEHATIHGFGTALYKCEWCDKTFNFSSSKSLHKKTQHPVEWLQSRDETYKWTKKVQQQTNQNIVDSSNNVVDDY